MTREYIPTLKTHQHIPDDSHLLSPDYEPVSLSVTLDPLSNRSCFAGAIFDDLLALEGDEDFNLTLGDPMLSGLLIGRDRTVVNIIDDDGRFFLPTCMMI